jgi:hypothetical protein
MEEEKKPQETVHSEHEHHHEAEHHHEVEHHEPEHSEHHEHHVHHEHHAEVPAQTRKVSKVRVWQVMAAIFAILFIASMLTSGFKSFTSAKSMSKEAVAEKTITYINTNLLQSGTTATLNSVKEENDLYVINMTISGQSFASYVSKNGELFFPQAFDTTVTVPKPADTTEPAVTPTTVKSDKPKVELFVMSHCPYGTQAEKGILPAVQKLGNKIDFSIKFVYYAMHGEKEVKEEMAQVCLMNEQNSKYFSYLTCFLNTSDSASCQTSAGIDKAALASCVAKLDKQYNVTALYNDQSSWLSGRYPLFNVFKADNEKYSIGGSPTLVINGAQAESSRSPAAYLATICGAFNTPPAECESQLSSTTFSAGFGYSASDSTALAQCG